MQGFTVAHEHHVANPNNPLPTDCNPRTTRRQACGGVNYAGGVGRGFEESSQTLVSLNSRLENNKEVEGFTVAHEHHVARRGLDGLGR